MLLTVFSLLISQFCFSIGAGYHQGYRCSIRSEKLQGTCTPLLNCSWALTRVKLLQHVDKCNEDMENPIVCCPLDEKIGSGQPLGDVLGQYNLSQNLIRRKRTPRSLSEKKCLEYYPSVVFVGAGGDYTSLKEFPHMAILGYGNENEKAWRCGGSLISYQHILTAAHCVQSSDMGEVKYVRLGVLDIRKEVDKMKIQDFKVKLAVPHPDFDPLTLKHDIAILILDEPVRVTDYVKPACLFQGGVIEYSENITATGWGITELAGDLSSHLLKLHLKIVENADCKQQYHTIGTRGNIDEELQVCAGSAIPEKIIDTCEGDSGGPLQYPGYNGFNGYYKIIGVTSFGKRACGISRSAGVYTRVSPHLSWIESIVWNKL